jgi:hypothetical protein
MVVVVVAHLGEALSPLPRKPTTLHGLDETDLRPSGRLTTRSAPLPWYAITARRFAQNCFTKRKIFTSLPTIGFQGQRNAPFPSFKATNMQYERGGKQMM